jgi:4a-hydroxytetrahydrobiopterin dehydratase
VPPPTEAQAISLLVELSGWKVKEGKKLTKEYLFKDFAEAVQFVGRVAKVAEAEGHHPDIFLHDYKYVTLTLYTHAVGGLTENDFIVAAKIDEPAHV